MSEESKKDQDTEAGSSKSDTNKKPRWFLIALALFIVAGAAYGFGLFDRISSKYLDKTSNQPAFHKVEETVFSSENLLSQIGSSAQEPAKVPDSDDNIVGEIDKKPEFCPPAGVLAGTAQEQSPQDNTPDIKIPVANQIPDQSDSPLKKETPPGPMKQIRSTPIVTKPEIKKPIEEKPKPAESDVSSKQNTPENISGNKANEDTKQKSDEFQLPGSLTVKIHTYTGSIMKWDLMVIYDDSAHMGRKVKSWNSSRNQIVENFLSKLPSALTNGSRLAVRDFHCGKAESKKETACLSRMVYGWGESPFADLKEKLGNIKPGGKNNACAAAAYSLRKDFPSMRPASSPRILIITEGISKCAYGEVLKALEEHQDRNKIVIDLLMFGSQKKKQDGYTALAKRTGGLIMKLDNPADLDSTLAKYAKQLKARSMERIEVRGEKTVYSTLPDEEITLAPGIYEIKLPMVAGIGQNNRVIPNVKIAPGEAKTLDVRIKKGKTSVKVTK